LIKQQNKKLMLQMGWYIIYNEAIINEETLFLIKMFGIDAISVNGNHNFLKNEIRVFSICCRRFSNQEVSHLLRTAI